MEIKWPEKKDIDTYLPITVEERLVFDYGYNIGRSEAIAAYEASAEGQKLDKKSFEAALEELNDERYEAMRPCLHITFEDFSWLLKRLNSGEKGEA